MLESKNLIWAKKEIQLKADLEKPINQMHEKSLSTKLPFYMYFGFCLSMETLSVKYLIN